MNFSKEPFPDGAIRLRFAPSPTGDLHLGGARTALFNYLFAKSNGGQFVLRVEDTDQVRSTEKATRQLIESLHWLGIDWDEGPGLEPTQPDRGDHGPYFQKARTHIYQEKIRQLLDQKKIYPCFCSDQELSLKRRQAEARKVPYLYDRNCLSLSPKEIESLQKTKPNWVYRFKVGAGEIVFQDEVKGKIRFNSQLISDFVIRKSDGFPTYNFAVVVDDAMMGITHVIRGDDHISNTPKQILLYQAMGMPLPKFYHLAMILGDAGEKLSKRHGALSVLEYRKRGYYPDPLINHLALLGWSPEAGEEVLSRSQLENIFTQPKFSSAPAVFNQERLDYLNGLYLRNLDFKIVLADFKKALVQAGYALTHPKIDLILLQLRDHCKKISDIIFEFQNFTAEVDEKVFTTEEYEWLQKDHVPKLLRLARDIFSNCENDFIEKSEFKVLAQEAKKHQIKGKDFFMPLRLQLTGRSQGLELDLFLTLNFRKKILERLERKF